MNINKGYMKVNYVLVHINRKSFPKYIYTCLEQIRLTNPEAEIYLAYYSSCEEINYKRLNTVGCHLIDLKKHLWSIMHFRFKLRNRGIFTTERFFVLYEIMRQYGLTDVIHVENDVMVYADVSKFMNVLQENYDLGFVRDSDERCIASFVYIKNASYLKPLCKHFILAGKNVNDMNDISKYGHRVGLHYLPVVTELYSKQEKMLFTDSKQEKVAIKMPSMYCENIEKFRCIFDGVTYGLYLGGLDKRINAGDTRGYVNEAACYSAEKCKIIWKVIDMKYIPFFVYGNEKLPIVNLHIHSKELEKYISNIDNPELFFIIYPLF